MKEVDLSGHDLNDEKVTILSSCIHNVEGLNISLCKFSAVGLEKILDAIDKKTIPVIYFSFLSSQVT